MIGTLPHSSRTIRTCSAFRGESWHSQAYVPTESPTFMPSGTLDRVSGVKVDLVLKAGYPPVLWYMTYQQSLEAVRTHCGFIPEADQGLVLGGNMAGLLGL